MNTINYPLQLQSFSVRIYASLVWIFSCLSLITYFYRKDIALGIVFYLFYEFFITFLGFFSFSIFKIISEKILNHYFKNKGEWIYYRPKRFAKFCGTIILFFSILFYFINPIIFLILLGILSLFSFLEAFLNVCIACKIYYLAQKLKIIPPDTCTDCK